MNEPGPKADVWIAREILGWQLRIRAGQPAVWWTPEGGATRDVPNWTTDRKAAVALARDLGVSVRSRDPWHICLAVVDAATAPPVPAAPDPEPGEGIITELLGPAAADDAPESEPDDG